MTPNAGVPASYRRLQAERDAYREALEAIKAHLEMVAPGNGYKFSTAWNIANKAILSSSEGRSNG